MAPIGHTEDRATSTVSMQEAIPCRPDEYAKAKADYAKDMNKETGD